MEIRTDKSGVSLLRHLFVVLNSRSEWSSVVRSEERGAEISQLDAYASESKWCDFGVEGFGQSYSTHTSVGVYQTRGQEDRTSDGVLCSSVQTSIWDGSTCSGI